MTGVRDMTVGSFVAEAGAKTPTPGGGAIAALGGALGVSMALMAARFTTGKKKFAAVAQEIEGAIAKLETLSARLLDLVDADRSAYSAVSDAYALPKDTEEQQAARKEAVRAACVNGAKPPEGTLSACREALDIVARLAEIANPMLLSDVGVAAEMLAAAAGSAFLNVRENAKVIAGDEGGKMLAEAKGILEKCRASAGGTVQKVSVSE